MDIPNNFALTLGFACFLGLLFLSVMIVLGNIASRIDHEFDEVETAELQRRYHARSQMARPSAVEKKETAVIREEIIKRDGKLVSHQGATNYGSSIAKFEGPREDR